MGYCRKLVRAYHLQRFCYMSYRTQPTGLCITLPGPDSEARQQADVM